MKERGLLLSLFPAPYRVDLFNRFLNVFDVDVFLEKYNEESRNSEWLKQGGYYVLKDKEGRRAYTKRLKAINNYSFVALYEYATVESVKLILKCKSHKVPYIINSDGVLLEKHGNFIREIIKRYLIKGAAGYFASGINAKEYFLKYGADERKIFIHTFSELERQDILDCPLSHSEKADIRLRLGLPVSQKIAIAVGRFIPLKRYDALIKAWKEMPDDYTLLLVGGGSEEQNYRDIIEAEHIDNIMICKFMPKDKLFMYYKAADVFVHPTSYDVWGLVVNEAMANGLPVIVSDHCVAGLELIQNGKNGYQIAMGSDKEMCQRVIEIMADVDLYEKMSKNVLETIRPYTMTNMANVQIKAIKEIISE